MKLSRFYFLMLTVFAAGFAACDRATNDVTDKNYVKQLEEHRKEKDRDFKFKDYSPLRMQDKENFRGLNYYPVDESYKVLAKIEKATELHIVQITYNNGEIQQFVRWAGLHFELKGIPMELNAYKNMQMAIDPRHKDYVFVPFLDETNGLETYGGGRYLEVTQLDDETMILDFNLAYNPYCVYNADYICPLPPADNKLPVPVRAGEKNFRQ